ncbi:hypothetical protein [Caballeronia sp. LZ034LL]|uniref:hypothetical protein n=1 Tax=Caballeronia sp. LZ034LL TaxID=3038567 RepID=UPI00285768A3|nr:hypothetical protein [Caballeronia sp. LZ034LL]MDR5835160.1 hypothetical protein [Caballeronia sp. LZ034LL]
MRTPLLIRCFIAMSWAIALILSLIFSLSPARARSGDAAPISASAGPPPVGVQVKVETFTGQDARAIARAGFRFIRLGVWTDHMDDAAYMQRVAAAFDLATRARLPVLLTLRSTRPLPASGETDGRLLNLAGKRFGMQVRAMARTHAPELIGIELWNEPDLDRYWPTGNVRETFAPFMHGVCDELRRAPLHVSVAGFGFAHAPRRDNTAGALLDAVLAASPGCIDTVSYHAYGMTSAQINATARSLRDRYGLPAAITEWGAPSRGAVTSSPARQASRVDAFVAALDTLSASLVSLYEWKDTARAGNERERSFGLVDADGAPKPALAPVLDYIGKAPGGR